MSTILDLGTLGGPESDAIGINASGEVAGWSENSAFDTRAFHYRDGTMTDLGTLGGSYSTAFNLNNTGQVVGDSALPGTTAYHAFLSARGQMRDLGTLGGLLSTAYAINDDRQVAGVADYSGYDAHAFLWQAGAMIDLGTFGGTTSGAYSINASGEIVGRADYADGTYHAFRWTPDEPNGTTGTKTDLGTLGGSWSVAYGINDSSQVVGAAQDPASGYNHAFLYSDGAMTDLGTLGGMISVAYSINNAGQVVGDLFSGSSSAFLWQDGVMTDLNQLLPQGSGWTLTNAQAINDRGQIVGEGINPSHHTHGYLLSLDDAEAIRGPSRLDPLAAQQLAYRSPLATAAPDTTLPAGGLRANRVPVAAAETGVKPSPQTVETAVSPSASAGHQAADMVSASLGMGEGSSPLTSPLE